MIKERSKKLWQEINKSREKPSAFLITNPKNIFYLSEFCGEGILLSTSEKKYLITDSRYTEQANQEVRDCQIIIQELNQVDAQTKSLCTLISSLNIKEIGFESNSLPVSKYLKYQSSMPRLTLHPFENVIEKLRMIKDSHEIELMKRSARIATNSFIQTIPSIKNDISELAIAAQLNYNMRKNGAKKEAFDLIVTSGERGTLIHGEPSTKKIKEGELVIVDFGCIFEMYHSDCTRSFVLGDTGSEKKKLFDIIKKTQIETLQQVKAGKSCSELDGFARRIIRESGYGDYFSHSLGHGVGLDIHELPRLSSNDQTILQPGMVVTIEPGIYVPGVGGVRIEDTILVTEQGCQILTLLPKELSISDYDKEEYNDVII
ncbi:MAG TPA: Xaa-Pro peptidase family protein [Atribacterota bacterium]|nr:Xaa-Pro peptidase family protein [Atribacterota bacterium]